MRDPGATTTYGVGELINIIIAHGCSKIVVGCGDSGTSDGGAGALEALGVVALNKKAEKVKRGGSNLVHAKSLDTSGMNPRLRDVTITMRVTATMC